MTTLPEESAQKLRNVQSQKSPMSAFLWKDRKDNFHSPCQMDTRHVFFTLRMIWNHCAPEEWKFKPYTKYRFSSYYTEDYMKQAIKVLLEEIACREDVQPYQIKTLFDMRNHFHTIFKFEMIGE